MPGTLTQPETARFTLDQDAGTLSLTHPLMTAKWSWSEHGRIDLTTFVHKVSETSWIAESPPDPLFLLGVEGYGDRFHTFDDHRPVFVGDIVAVEINKAAKRGCIESILTLDLSRRPAAAEDPPVYDDRSRAWHPVPIKVTWHIQAHPDHAVLRQWFEVTNIGNTALTVTRLPVLLINLRGDSARLTAESGLERIHRFRKQEGADWFTWKSLPLGPGVVGHLRTGHRLAATWLAFTTSEGPGLFAGWETNAHASCDYGDLHGTGAGSIDVWLEPAYRLAPRQSLTGPAAFLGVADGDLDELSYRTHRFVEAVIAKQVDDPHFPYSAFNSWGYGPDIDDASMRTCFEKCRKLGIELFVVDFGWEDPDWHPLTDKFPNGLAPLADEAHKAGMLFGIHLSFGNVSSLSTMYREHPEWVNGLGQWAYHREGEALALSLGHPDARDWIANKLLDIIDETQADYFLTDHFLWGSVNPEAVELHATDNYMTTSEGFDVILDRVHQARPHVLMEHCDNGLGLPTFKMTAQHVTSIGADAVGSQYERVSTWRLSRVLPPRYLDHYVCERHAPHIPFDKPLGDYEYRSQMFGGPMIFMTDILGIEEGSEDWNAFVQAIGVFKRIRKQVAEGKVLHLLEPQPYERVDEGWDGWDAIGSYHEPTDSAVILVFRLGGNVEGRNIPIHGLNDSSQYRVTFEDRRDTFVRSGAELMGDGMFLTLPDPNGPKVVDDLGFVRASEVIQILAI